MSRNDGTGGPRSPLELIALGWAALHAARRPPSFDSWRDWIKKSATGAPVLPDEFDWMWESLRASSAVRRDFGSLAPASARWPKPLPVLAAGTELLLLLKESDRPIASRATRPSDNSAVVTLESALSMGKGKKARLECLPVKCVIAMLPPELGSSHSEAKDLKIDLSRVRVTGERLEVQVRSLNHAYTMFSRRVEPGRASHGGRIYDRMFVRLKGHWTSLEEVRVRVEEGNWKFPHESE